VRVAALSFASLVRTVGFGVLCVVPLLWCVAWCAAGENGAIFNIFGCTQKNAQKGMFFVLLCVCVIARDRRTAPPNPAGGSFVWLV
jgi:hypothetical protein